MYLVQITYFSWNQLELGPEWLSKEITIEATYETKAQAKQQIKMIFKPLTQIEEVQRAIKQVLSVFIAKEG